MFDDQDDLFAHITPDQLDLPEFVLKYDYDVRPGECFFWYQLTPVVPDKRPLNGCVCVCLLHENYSSLSECMYQHCLLKKITAIKWNFKRST